MAAASIWLATAPAQAEGLFDFFFGGPPKSQQRQAAPQPQNNIFDPFGLFQQQQAAPQRPVAAAGYGPAYCVRTCDGKYFPLAMRGGASPVQICQAFCPATSTKVFFGGSIDDATASTGERYADSPNAFSYRKALRADCTCNGRDPLGLAPVDLALDTSLRPGDVIATSTGLVAYSGAHAGTGQGADFTPVASYPGLTNDVRARLGEMKVAPVSADTISDDNTSRIAPPAPPAAPSRRAATRRAAAE